MVFIWLLAAIGFALFELHHLAFYALFVAAGSVAAAGVAAIAPDAYVAQAVVAAVVAVAGVGLVRPSLRAAYERRNPHSEAARGVHGGLVGNEAVTLDEVGDAHHVGHVRLLGERWLAVTDTSIIPTGAKVIVTAVRGTTLTVVPVDAISGRPNSLPPATDPNRS